MLQVDATAISGSVDPLIDGLCADFAKLAPENKFTRTDPTKVIPSFLRHSVRRPLLRQSERWDVPASYSDRFLLPAVVGVNKLLVVQAAEGESGQTRASYSFSDDTLIMSPNLMATKQDFLDKDADDHDAMVLAPSGPASTTPNTTVQDATQTYSAILEPSAAADTHEDPDCTLHELEDDSNVDDTPSTLPEYHTNGLPGSVQRCSVEDTADPTTISPSTSCLASDQLNHTDSAGALATVDDSDEAASGFLPHATSEAELDTRDSPPHQDSIDSIDLPLDDSDWFRTSSPRSPRPRSLSVLPGLSLASLGEPLDSDDSANCLGLDFGSDASPVPTRARTRPQSPRAWLVDDSDVSLELETVCSTAPRLLVTEDYYCDSPPQRGLPSALSCSSSLPGSVSGLDPDDEEGYPVEGEDEDGWALVRKGLGCVALAGSVACLYLAVLTY
ncbi:hypothetical protein C8Q70DRAFT_931789 [Cubamyces menziesii]|nr:hypothetical protein C8Q70DRAFT_931789 [Cubamyces menziesii]